MPLNPEKEYQITLFKKIAFNFQSGKELLDIGCGPGADAQYLTDKFDVIVSGIDIYKHGNIGMIQNFKFKQASIHQIPFPDNSFDYILLHDVLHHIDENCQDIKNIIKALQEVKRVCKNGGNIIIVEANRYNPISFLHMVLVKKHKEFGQLKFLKIIKGAFNNYKFRTFEAHVYPKFLYRLFKVYEFLMDSIFVFKPLRSYNLAIINNVK